MFFFRFFWSSEESGFRHLYAIKVQLVAKSFTDNFNDDLNDKELNCQDDDDEQVTAKFRKLDPARNAKGAPLITQFKK